LSTQGFAKQNKNDKEKMPKIRIELLVAVKVQNFGSNFFWGG